jgi:Reverse transcriptase (RNA-dependent DNA polymerase)
VGHLFASDWNSKLFVAVRWNDRLSSYLTVGSGVRQGRTLSAQPVKMFNSLTSKLTVDLKTQSLGCLLNKTWINCILYADDIIILSASILSLQLMLNNCYEVVNDLGPSINYENSCCFAVGPGHKRILPILSLGSKPLELRSHVKYLGISFVSGYNLNCDSNSTARKFYAASNCILNNTCGSDESLQLNLQ